MEKMIIEHLIKDMQFTLEYESDTNGILMQLKEMPDIYEYADDEESCIRELARGLKEWSAIFISDFEGWRKGRESEILYLFKILLSSEEELISELKRSQREEAAISEREYVSSNKQGYIRVSKDDGEIPPLLFKRILKQLGTTESGFTQE